VPHIAVPLVWSTYVVPRDTAFNVAEYVLNDHVIMLGELRLESLATVFPQDAIFSQYPFKVEGRC
jgi:hypothetical protein